MKGEEYGHFPKQWLVTIIKLINSSEYTLWNDMMLLLGLVSYSWLSIAFNLYTSNHNIYVLTDYFVLIFRGGLF